MNKVVNKVSKRIDAARKVVGSEVCTIAEGLRKIQACPRAKFEEGIDVVICLRISGTAKEKVPIRGSVKLPHGVGKEYKIAVFAGPGEEVVGADRISSVPDVAQFKSVISKYHRCGATPAGMTIASKVAAIIGPMGMMPSAKNNTVMADVSALVNHLKTSVFFVENSKSIMARVGSVSMDAKSLEENVRALYEAVLGFCDGKNQLIEKCYICSTMSPSVVVKL